MSTPEVPDAPETVALTVPADGIPDVVDSPASWESAVEQLTGGHGPIAADAERASGFRYGQATYLVQLKRAGAGLFLIDTAAVRDLSALTDALGDAEWVLHAASQDLPGLKDLGVQPTRVFDTELAARLLGWPRVGLAAVVERELGLTLAKEHSAQDWSVRPLPREWLIYAALDVEVLLELRDRLAEHLAEAGKTEWAAQEFEAVRTAEPPPAREDPWRRTSGCHTVKDQRGLAIVRALWEARDSDARRRDVAPGRVLRDQAIVAAALAKPTTLEALLEVPAWQSKGTRRRAEQWYRAIAQAMALPDAELPSRRGPSSDGPPQVRVWKDKRPVAAARLAAARAFIADLSEQHQVPAENILQPDALRRVCWDYDGQGEAWVDALLTERGARPWQRSLTVSGITAACEAVTDSAEPLSPQ